MSELAPLSEIEVAIIDAGTFIPLAETMGKAAKRTYYYSPWEQEYVGLERCVIGDGFKNVSNFSRLDDFMDPEVFDRIKLWCFPDIGFGGLQRYLRRQGKLVWGSMGTSDLELYRTKFVEVLKAVGLPMVKSVKIVGLTKLVDYLKENDRKWVKVNRYRDNMETWFHLDFKHSQREFERLAYVFGPFADYITFLVQDEIAEEEGMPVLEIGYDGWLITSPEGEPQFPESSFQGYEKKNELYLGSKLRYLDMPEEVRYVNSKFAPVLAEAGYRNFMANEIRVKDGVPHFIDPTNRMAGQTMEHLLETCTNLPEVMYRGAAGENVTPEFSHDFSAEATIHYHPANGDGMGWKTLVVPEEAAPFTKLYRCAYLDGAYQFPPHKSNELGIILGQGDSIEESVENLKENFEHLKDEPVSIELSGFADLIHQIEDAHQEGVEFTDQALPDPQEVLEDK